MFGEKDWESVARHVGTRKARLHCECTELQAVYHGLHMKSVRCLLYQCQGLRCRQRWMNTLKPGHVKGKWTKKDDDHLRQLVAEEHAARGKDNVKWSVVASKIPGRNIKQVGCRVQLATSSTLR